MTYEKRRRPKENNTITMEKFAPAYSIKDISSVSHGLPTVQKNGNSAHDTKGRSQIPMRSGRHQKLSLERYDCGVRGELREGYKRPSFLPFLSLLYYTLTWAQH